jgi:hypothetical protein
MQTVIDGYFHRLLKQTTKGNVNANESNEEKDVMNEEIDHLNDEEEESLLQNDENYLTMKIINYS